MELRRDGRPLRVGHRGAPALAPENTLASLRAAVEAGLDAVEFDVLEDNGALVLAHSRAELPAELLSLDGALEWLREQRCVVHVDVKGDGLEERIVAALDLHGVAGRAYVSTTSAASLRRFAALVPELPRALTYPEDRLGLSRTPLGVPLTTVGTAALRLLLPARIGRLLERAQATIASLNHAVVSRAVVERCHALGVPVVAWTVDEPARVAEVAALGVDAVVSNDPRVLLGTLPS